MIDVGVIYYIAFPKGQRDIFYWPWTKGQREFLPGKLFGSISTERDYSFCLSWTLDRNKCLRVRTLENVKWGGVKSKIL